MNKGDSNAVILGDHKGPQAVLPASWYAAAGLMAHKKKALEKHAKQVRKEWDSSR